MADTIQRLQDLQEIADNAEVKLLAKILEEHLKQEKKNPLGFQSDKKGTK